MEFTLMRTGRQHLAKRTQQETAITELTYRKNQLTREIDRYDLHKLYQN